MIPANLLQDRRNIDNLLQYLLFELQRTRGERVPLEEDWSRYQVKYRAKPEFPERTFPWKGAANLVIPVIATDVDTTVSGLMGVLFQSPNLWSTEALRPDWIDFAARLQEFLGWAQDAELGMYDVVLDWVTELTKLGTGILKWRYIRETKRMFEWREQPGGMLSQIVNRMAVNRPDVRRVALADFFIPATANSVVEAPWCAERLQLTYSQLQARVRAGIYLPETLDRIAYSWRSSQPASQYASYQNVQEQLDNFLPGFNDRFELFEFWLNYQIDRNQDPMALVCTIHVPTMTYARIDFNPFFNQEKPYAEARFIRQEGRFYGLGLGDILEMFQEEISTMHCQRLDNNTIKNASVFKGRTGSGVKPDEPIWPGRTIMMADPEKDLVSMQMGTGNISTIADEEFTLQYARQRSNVSDYQRGGAGNASISYSTATTTVEMLRQGRLRLDQVLREIQSGLGKVGRGVVELYQQFDQQGKTFLVMGQRDGAAVQQVLQFPLDMLRAGVAVRVTATNAQLNKETQIRTNQIIFGMVMQFYQQMMQAMTYAFNPQVPPPMQQMALSWVQGGMVLARRILDEYNIQDIDRIIPDLGGTSDTGQQQQLTQPGAQFGGAPMGQGLIGPSGVSAPPGGYSGANGLGSSNLNLLQQYAGAFPGAGQMGR
jgi:hypothetical protein